MLIADVVQLAFPLTPEVARFCPKTNPLMVADSCGFVVPYGREVSFAVTVRSFLVIVSVLGTKVRA